MFESIYVSAFLTYTDSRILIPIDFELSTLTAPCCIPLGLVDMVWDCHAKVCEFHDRFGDTHKCCTCTAYGLIGLTLFENTDLSQWWTILGLWNITSTLPVENASYPERVIWYRIFELWWNNMYHHLHVFCSVRCADNDHSTLSDEDLTLRKNIQGFGHLQMYATVTSVERGLLWSNGHEYWLTVRMTGLWGSNI